MKVNKTTNHPASICVIVIVVIVTFSEQSHTRTQMDIVLRQTENTWSAERVPRTDVRHVSSNGRWVFARSYIYDTLNPVEHDAYVPLSMTCHASERCAAIGQKTPQHAIVAWSSQPTNSTATLVDRMRSVLNTWSTEDRTRREIMLPDEDISVFQFSHDGTLLAVLSHNLEVTKQQLRIYNATGPVLTHVSTIPVLGFNAPPSTYYSQQVSFTCDNARVICIVSDRLVVFDLQKNNYQIISSLPYDGDMILTFDKAVCSPRNNALVFFKARARYNQQAGPEATRFGPLFGFLDLAATKIFWLTGFSAGPAEIVFGVDGKQVFVWDYQNIRTMCFPQAISSTRHTDANLNLVKVTRILGDSIRYVIPIADGARMFVFQERDQLHSETCSTWVIKKWDPRIHHLFDAEFKAVVFQFMCTMEYLKRQALQGGSASAKALFAKPLPLELILLVLGKCSSLQQ